MASENPATKEARGALAPREPADTEPTDAEKRSAPEPAPRNVGIAERWVSGALGGWLLLIGVERLAKLRASGLLALAGGGALLDRALRGRCPIYRRLGVDPADTRRLSHPLDRNIRLRESIVIRRPSAELYRLWRELPAHPRFVPHVQAVHAENAWESHWVVRGPLGNDLEWDALITDDRPDEWIAWRTLPGADVGHSGRVRFVPLGNDVSRVDVDVDCYVPFGAVGALVARVLGRDPAAALRGALARFRTLAELSPDVGATARDASSVPDDVVGHSSWASFPASDPPSWSSTRA